MKGKNLIKLLGMLLFFVMFIFVEDVSAYSFVDEKYNDLTVVSIRDNNYERPSSEDVDLSGCTGCTVTVNNTINTAYAGAYEVSYHIKDFSNVLLQTLTRQYYVVDNTPYLKTETGVGSTTPLANEVNKNPTEEQLKNNKKGKLAYLWTFISIVVYILGFGMVFTVWEENFALGIFALLIALAITPFAHKKAISFAQEQRRIQRYS